MWYVCVCNMHECIHVCMWCTHIHMSVCTCVYIHVCLGGIYMHEHTSFYVYVMYTYVHECITICVYVWTVKLNLE